MTIEDIRNKYYSGITVKTIFGNYIVAIADDMKLSHSVDCNSTPTIICQADENLSGGKMFAIWSKEKGFSPIIRYPEVEIY